ncbi:MAG: TraB/GumN family protein [Gammaproteobacteria bacterium]|nr:TraB/GumN family protein [Gammaproteobacteria bacterium]
MSRMLPSRMMPSGTLTRLITALLLLAAATVAAADPTADRSTTATVEQVPASATVDPASTSATADAPPSDSIEEVTIVGEAAGPGLWKVRNGDNTLYILGTLSPLPKKMEWRSREVENVLSRAKQVIPARSEVDADIGPIKAVRLYMQFRKVRGNDDKQTLQQVLPADLYQRFEALRGKYAPRERSMLQRRPLIAAGELWGEAVSRSGLTSRNDVSRAVEKLAKKRKVDIVLPKIFVDDPSGLLAEVGTIPRDAEVGCMRSTLDRLESDLADTRRRAEAWAVGDVETLRSRRSSEQQKSCWSALQQSPKIAALRKQFEDAWFKLAVEAVEQHDVALAVVPIEELFGREGVIARMQARGYRVDDP